jgi:hypothetical protein
MNPGSEPGVTGAEKYRISPGYLRVHPVVPAKAGIHVHRDAMAGNDLEDFRIEIAEEEGEDA